MTVEERQRHCDALRDRLWIGRQANYESIDKNILGLSSGALALSIAFIKDVVPLAAATWFFLLMLSWLLFAAAITFTLLACLTSQAAHDRQLENVEAFRSGEDGALEENNNRHIASTKWLNRAAVICFFTGLFATLTFVGINTAKVRYMSDSNKSAAPPEKRGIVPPSLPSPPRQPPPDKPAPQKK
jgi:hypothetical protein